MAASLTSTDLTLDNTSGASIPGTPSAGQTVIYPKDDKLLYYKDDAGVERLVNVTAGTVVQIVHTTTGAVATGTTVIPGDDTIPQITEGDQYMSLAITPLSATNRLFIEHIGSFAHPNINAVMCVALFVGTTANALGCHYDESPAANRMPRNYSVSHDMVAGVTTTLTFRVRAGGDAGTTTFNGRAGNRMFGGVIASILRITEYTP